MVKLKLSVFKCEDCEALSERGEAIPFLIHYVGRRNKCPLCGSVKLNKISISTVMNNRWNEKVRARLASMRQRISEIDSARAES